MSLLHIATIEHRCQFVGGWYYQMNAVVCVTQVYGKTVRVLDLIRTNINHNQDVSTNNNTCVPS